MLQMPSSQGESGKGWAMSVIMHVVHGVNTYRDVSVASSPMLEEVDPHAPPVPTTMWKSRKTAIPLHKLMCIV
jgi:hypothetical protein